MKPRALRATRTDTLYPYTTMCRSERQGGGDHALDPGLGKAGNLLSHGGVVGGDAVDVGVQQLLAEIQGRAVHCPGLAVALIGAEQQALAFLAQVVLGIVVAGERDLLDRKSTRLNSSH